MKFETRAAMSCQTDHEVSSLDVGHEPLKVYEKMMVSVFKNDVVH